jgi:tetratricopeptide (TPR) repeat protein
LDAARRDYEEALEISRAAGDHRRVAVTLTNLGYAELLDGDEPVARRHLDEAVRIAGDMRDPTLISYLFGLLGLIDVLGGDGELARRRLAESFTMACRVGLKQQMANATLGAALIAAKADPELAATLHGVADQMIEQGERSFEPVEAGLREGDVSRLREALGEAGFEETYRKGHRLLGTEAVAFVRSQLEPVNH